MAARKERRLRESMKKKLEQKFDTDFKQLFDNLQFKYAEQEKNYHTMTARLAKYKAGLIILFSLAVFGWIAAAIIALDRIAGLFR